MIGFGGFFGPRTSFFECRFQEKICIILMWLFGLGAVPISYYGVNYGYAAFSASLVFLCLGISSGVSK